MTVSIGVRAGQALAMIGLAALAGCGGPPGESGSSLGLGNALLLAGTTVAPAQATVIDEVYCPPVTVSDGGAAIQTHGVQVTLGQLARECVGRPDGSILVKVGVEGRALLGQGGSAGRIDAPLQILVKDGSTVFANRTRRLAVAIPAGDTMGTFTAVEGNIVVPAASATDFEIEVGLGTRAVAGRRR